MSVGSDWHGVVEVLQNEFAGDDDEASSMADKLIMASLANIGGATQQQVTHLFMAFALVPEDTFCPLEIMTMLYEAEVFANQAIGKGMPPPTAADIQCSKPPARLLIRKWLKILINRSLVLGTVDRSVAETPPPLTTTLDFGVVKGTLGAALCVWCYWCNPPATSSHDWSR